MALAVAALSVIPIRRAYRKMRIGDLDITDHGAMEQTFWASLWVGVAACIYPYTLVLIVGVWMAFIVRHMMSLRAWMASFLALGVCAFWYAVLYYFQYV